MSLDLLGPLLQKVDVKTISDVITQGTIAFIGLMCKNFYTTFSKDYAKDIMKMKNIKNYGFTVVIVNLISLFFSIVVSMFLISIIPKPLQNMWLMLMISLICGAIGPEVSRGVSRAQVKGDTVVKSFFRYLGSMLKKMSGGTTIIDDDVVSEYKSSSPETTVEDDNPVNSG